MQNSVTVIFITYKIGVDAGKQKFHSVWKNNHHAQKAAAVLNKTMYYMGEYTTQVIIFTDDNDDQVKALNIAFDKYKLKLSNTVSFMNSITRLGEPTCKNI